MIGPKMKLNFSLRDIQLFIFWRPFYYSNAKKMDFMFQKIIKRWLQLAEYNCRYTWFTFPRIVTAIKRSHVCTNNSLPVNPNSPRGELQSPTK